MENIKRISRKDLVLFYLNQEYARKQKEIPPALKNCDLDNIDVNELDRRFEMYSYKKGVIPAFRQWRYVRLSKEELLDCAIVNSIFPELSQKLGDLITLPEFRSWKPDRPTSWYDCLNSGGELTEELALILRPPVTSERNQGAMFYIEDGSGRAICYVRRKIKYSQESCAAYVFIGFDPDPDSRWLRVKLPDLLP